MLNKFRSGSPIHSKGITAIPFELGGHLILMPVRINDCEKEYTFFLDTCAQTIIDLRVASDLHIENGRELPLPDETMPEAFLSKTNVDISLGNAQVRDLKVLLLDLSSWRKSGRSIDGVVGSDFLRFFRVTIDYRERMVLLEQSRKAGNGSSTTRIPTGGSTPDAAASTGTAVLDNKGYAMSCATSFPLRFPTVRCRLDGDIVAEALLDTGSPFAIVAPLSLMEKQDFAKERTLLESEGILFKWPFSPIERNYLARLESFQMGELQVAELPVIYANSGDVLLGRSFLSQFVVTIDYPSDELILLPYSDTHFDQNLFSAGFRLKRDEQDRTVVRGFWKGSPADRNGLRPGDEVLFINSMDVGDLTDLEISRLLKDETVPVIELVIKEGDAERRVSLEKEMLFPEVDE
jgi:hypothetical protein